MSMRWAGAAKRIAIIGSRLWPPARIFGVVAVLRKQDKRLVEALGSVVLELWDLHEQGPNAATRGPLDSATPVSALRPEACAWINV